MNEILSLIIVLIIGTVVFLGLLRHFLNLTKYSTKFHQIVGYAGLAVGSGMVLLFWATILRNLIR